MILPASKPIGITSRAFLNSFKSKFPNEKLGYVGTLDPMAEGLLLVVTGQDTKRVEELVSLPKEYEFEMLFGVSTDSGDLLGIVKSEEFKIKNLKLNSNLKFQIKNCLFQFVGEVDQQVPLFSSIKYKGRELHKWGREGKSDQVDLITRKVTIHKIELLNFSLLPYSAFEALVFERLAMLGSTSGKMFRKDEVIESWKEFFSSTHRHSGLDPESELNPILKRKGRLRREVQDDSTGKDRSQQGLSFPVAKMRVLVSRGTYIRSLAEDIGAKLGFPTMCLSIKRTRVGNFVL